MKRLDKETILAICEAARLLRSCASKARDASSKEASEGSETYGAWVKRLEWIEGLERLAADLEDYPLAPEFS